ncbi:hypothetical protein QYM36_004300 [Artemia franciscana]|uniref:Uncharacterized protein n=1 Tax=Artemia franciscana TaxID=6661 RepID=A0AA88IGA4_ARTSF|nr:hypothetical protein QYM36_004300 [Artemia franciscana]
MENFTVTLVRSESRRFGFTVIGGKGSDIPAVICDVVEGAPAFNCKEIESGDAIVAINGKDVSNCTAKEVLKCLRLASNEVTLSLVRDPEIRTKVNRYLQLSHSMESVKDAVSKEDFKSVREIGTLQKLLSEEESLDLKEEKKNSANLDDRVIHPANCGTLTSIYKNGRNVDDDMQQLDPSHKSNRKSPKDLDKAKTPRFEAYMMTGDVILNVSKTAPSPEIISPSAKQKKKDEVSLPSSPELPPLRKNEIPRTPITPDDSSDSQAFVYPNLRHSRSEDTLPSDRRSSGEENTASSLQTLLETKNSTDHDNDRIVWTYNAPTTGDSAKTSFDQTSIPDSVSPISEYDTRSLKYVELERPLLKSSDSQQSDISASSDKINLVSNASECSATRKQSFFEKLFRLSPKTHSVSSNSVESVSELSEVQAQSYSDLAVGEHEVSEEGISNCATLGTETRKASSPTLSEEESDLESLSYHYSPKAVDVPAAGRLAKRLFMLDGFHKSDIARHLSKNNDFSRAVAEEYLKHFTFEEESLDISLRKFLQAFQLTGESAERDRILVHFSKRYLECNPGSFQSQDSVHILTCALMLLNADLHGRAGGALTKKMTCSQFIKRLSGLNDGDNFPVEVLRQLYCSIKAQPLEWANDDSYEDAARGQQLQTQNKLLAISANPFLDMANPGQGNEFKRGYIMRKCCHDPGGKRTPLGKRGWKMYFAIIRDLILYLYKDEGGCRKQIVPSRTETVNGNHQRVDTSLPLENAQAIVRIHHALARPATDYKKKQHVICLYCADESQFYIQASDPKEMQSWMNSLNIAAAQLSSQTLAAPVGSQQRFQRPLMPSSISKFSLREQLRSYSERVGEIELELEDLKRLSQEKSNKSAASVANKEKEAFLQFEFLRYNVYIELLTDKIVLSGTMNLVPNDQLLEADEQEALSTERLKSLPNDRYSYHSAIKTGLGRR